MNNIFDLLQGIPQPAPMQNPGMSLPAQMRPYQNDVPTQPMGILDMISQLTGTHNNINLQGSPKTYSGQIQVALGAKPQNQGGFASDILTQRFQPPLATAPQNNIAPNSPYRPATWDNPMPQNNTDYAQNYADIGQGMLNSLTAGKLVTGQDIASDRAISAAKSSLLGKGGSTAYAQRMAMIQADPELSKLPIGMQMQIANGKVGTNLTVGSDGTVSDMSGAATGLGNLKYGENMGGETATQQVKQAYQPTTERLIADQKNQSDINAAQPKAAASTRGATQADMQTKLPIIEQNTAYSQKLLNDLVSHPGLPYGTGMMSMSPTIPGTEQADFRSRLSQINSMAFLQAFATLRGGGAISNTEGDKATGAITRLTTPGISQEDFIAAANELNDLLGVGLQRARGEAAGNFDQNFNQSDFNQQNLGGSNAIDEELRKRGIQ